MHTRILSRKGILYEGQVSSLTIPTKAGEITILDHHRPMVSVLARGTVRLKTERGETKTFPFRGGFLEVGPKNSLDILISEMI